ncbi:MAG TPA: RNA polymerase subunit sigma-24 [Lachnospiraceae bacterium]|nr:RNA polymerase subunit sigma-24 [Lachnospiraceae bacterium]
MIDVASNPSDAVETAMNLFGNDIFRLAFSYMKRKEDAEDIVQDVLVRFMQSENIFEDGEQMKAWLLRVAANVCKDYLKASERKKVVALPEGYETVASDEAIPEGESEVLAAVMALPEKYRSVIHLYYYQEYSTKEIAEILEKKEATIRSLLKRGRERLEKMMKGDDGYAKRV